MHRWAAHARRRGNAEQRTGANLREGMEELFTINRLGPSPALEPESWKSVRILTAFRRACAEELTVSFFRRVTKLRVLTVLVCVAHPVGPTARAPLASSVARAVGVLLTA